ncbi:MAG: tRNA (cytidine(56)-2'-O)-methyltransferase [Methanobrevibacter sp.]|jgi:tRNA (cytidine56-2'-O)-methyltransferase|nr:tRNA (cytidine(56)-2'-O)-methyltransferase [Candidatus Methanovirga aequatorialis]
MKVEVLRLNHRKRRDTRISTHVCLTARAFGASKIYLTGDEDTKLIKNVKDLVKRWGGSFEVIHSKNYMNIIEECQSNGGEVVHLTMYGLQVQNVVKDIQRSTKDKLIVVGGSRVPKKVYNKADWNVSVTNQPHSEVSSLAIFQHMLLDGKEFDINFDNPVFEIIPMPEGKKVDIKKDSD